MNELRKWWSWCKILDSKNSETSSICEDFAQINPRLPTPIVTRFTIAANVLNLIIFQCPYLLIVRAHLNALQHSKQFFREQPASATESHACKPEMNLAD